MVNYRSFQCCLIHSFTNLNTEFYKITALPWNCIKTKHLLECPIRQISFFVPICIIKIDKTHRSIIITNLSGSIFDVLDERHEREENTLNNGNSIHPRERHSSENNASNPAITTFTQKTASSFAIQQLLGLTSSSTGSNNAQNVSNSHGEGLGGGHGADSSHGNHHERFGSLNHHNHHSQHDLKNFSAEKFYNEAAAARSFLNAATSFSDQYNAAQRANYFNVSSAAAAGFFGNLQSQTAAAAAANAAAAASFPASMSPNSNMSHLLQVESSLRNDHPMHGRILNIK